MGHLFGDISYDTGASFLEDSEKYPHKEIKTSDYIEHLGGGSWTGYNDYKAFISQNKDYDSKIAIVIPCYNQEKYIKETIQSVKDQDYPDFSCVIVNDGSTDKSEDIILSEIYGDQRFRYFRIENSGPGYARNFGIQKTSSEYILCLDSDDLISSRYIKDAIEFLDKNQDITLYYGDAEYLYDSGKTSKFNLPEFNYPNLLYGNMIYVSGIFRRERYDEVGGFDEVIGGFEDWEFLIRLLYGGKKVYKSSDLVFWYRQHPGTRNQEAIMNIDKWIMEIHNKNQKIYDEYSL